MRIDLFFNPSEVSEYSLRGKNIVVIDVLRASTTIITALKNGAREIIPTVTVEDAVKISNNLFGDVVLRCGERGGKIISGFELGNSPLEYIKDVVSGKSLVFTSTNGSTALVRTRYANDVIIAGFVNVSIAMNYLVRKKNDFIILCAGKEGNFSIEDTVCGGMIIDEISRKGVKLELSDAAAAAKILYKSFSRSILKMVSESEHGQYLASIGYGDDLPVCAEVDSIPLIPYMKNGGIKAIDKQK